MSDARPAAKRHPVVPPKVRQYKVTSEKTVHGKTKGQVVNLALSDDLEKALVEAGHIERYEPPAKENKGKGKS